MFLKEGAILPHAPAGAENGDELSVHLYPASGHSSVQVLYEDDGSTFGFERGEVYEEEIRMAMDPEGKQLDIDSTIVSKGYAPVWNKKRFIIHYGGELHVKWNGKPVELSAVPGSQIRSWFEV
ncbi:DUF5110 domain-containing protein [Cohnella kolymensis]|uniref:DUF5110 domain-containing protein n=1 Tax=Cohnella kolymensis TaxID=1590652 RepID=UPI001F2C7A0D|nr:DUF5110 domain-containing protein [Cohnella kolymensis]